VYPLANSLATHWPSHSESSDGSSFLQVLRELKSYIPLLFVRFNTSSFVHSAAEMARRMSKKYGYGTSLLSLGVCLSFVYFTETIRLRSVYAVNAGVGWGVAYTDKTGALCASVRSLPRH